MFSVIEKVPPATQAREAMKPSSWCSDGRINVRYKLQTFTTLSDQNFHHGHKWDYCTCNTKI